MIAARRSFSLVSSFSFVSGTRRSQGEYKATVVDEYDKAYVCFPYLALSRKADCNTFLLIGCDAVDEAALF